MKPADLFNEATSAAGVRTEGVIIALLEWWIDAKNGLSNLDVVADQCSFEAVRKKCPEEVYEILSTKFDFRQAFLNMVAHDISMDFMLKLVVGPEDHPNRDANVEHFETQVDYRLQIAVAQRLFAGWWVKHDVRIKKERANYKHVAKVMES